MFDVWREVPPTAGLPLAARDFLRREANLEAAFAHYLHLPETQVECSGTAALVLALTAMRNREHNQRTGIGRNNYFSP